VGFYSHNKLRIVILFMIDDLHKLYKQFLENPPENIDCLIIEGTTIGRTEKTQKTEDDI